MTFFREMKTIFRGGGGGGEGGISNEMVEESQIEEV